MRKFFNKQTGKWYTEGQPVTFRLSDNSAFSGYPTDEQLKAWGYEEITPIVATAPSPGSQEEVIVTPEEEEQDPILLRMAEIKEQLRDMDYLTSKYIDGEDMSEYGDWQQERKALREEYRMLEEDLAAQ